MCKKRCCLGYLAVGWALSLARGRALQFFEGLGAPPRPPPRPRPESGWPRRLRTRQSLSEWVEVAQCVHHSDVTRALGPEVGRGTGVNRVRLAWFPRLLLCPRLLFWPEPWLLLLLPEGWASPCCRCRVL